MERTRQPNMAAPDDMALRLFALLDAGKNVFLTGPGGSGKSTLIQSVVRRYSGKTLAITSTTGISATHIRGSTLHSYLGLRLGTETVEEMATRISKSSRYRTIWKKLQLLILDEVSMLSPVLFDKIEEVARVIRKNPRPFGGIQLLFSGDFMQLPCVDCDRLCFQTDTWNRCFPMENVVYLSRIHRQNDPVFVDCLMKVRVGNVSEEVQALLNTRRGVTLENEHGIKPTILYPTNARVDSINQRELDLLRQKHPLHTYAAETRYRQELTTSLFSRLCVPETLQLTTECQVMLLWNISTERNLVNGSRGVVIGFDKESNFPIVRFMDATEQTIRPVTWEIYEGCDLVAEVVQIPLKLAYALTIHKSQGSTLDCVSMDLSQSFAFSQSYVALSRVRELKGLQLLGIDYSKIRAHPAALAFYESCSDNKY